MAPEEWMYVMEDILWEQVERMQNDGIGTREALNILKDTAQSIENYCDFNAVNELE